MSVGNPGIQPRCGAGDINAGESAALAPQGTPQEGDAEAFDTALGADGKKKKEAEETTLTWSRS